MATPRFKVGQRVKYLGGHLVNVPAGSTAEITGVDATGNPVMYYAEIRWKGAAGQVETVLSALVPEKGFDFGRGRLFFPGEAPPKTGESFGITGVNNDYRKLAKRGLRPPLKTAATPAVAKTADEVIGEWIEENVHLTPTPPAPQPSAAEDTPDMTIVKGSNAPPLDLSDEQAALQDTECPVCGSAPFVEFRGTLKTGSAAGQPFVILKCADDKCGTRVRRDGTIVPRSGKSLPATTTTTTPTPAVTVTTTTAAADEPATTVLSTAGAMTGKKSKAPATPVVQPSFTFPVKLAMKLASDVRTMAKQGSTEMTFSLRKALSWVTAATAFADSGVPEKDAIAAAFRITVFDRETEEARGKLEQLFQSIFGYKATDNVSGHPATKNDAVIGMALSHGLNLWVNGPTGAGKTYSVLERLKAANRKFIRVQGGGDITRETLVGYAALVGGTSTFKPGPLTYAMEHGLVLVLDEVDKLRDEVLSELTAVLEGNSLVLMDDGGREVPMAAGFGVLATANTVGRGEGLLYGGTRVVNEALRDRFIFLTVDYDDKRDTAIMMQHAKGLGAGVA